MSPTDCLGLSRSPVAPWATDDATAPVAEPDERYRALAVLATAMVLSMTTWFSASAVIPQLRAQWGLSATQASLLTIAVQMGFVAGALLSATLSLADLVPPRQLVLYGAVGAAAANALLLLANGPVLAIAARFLTGAALAAVYPPALKAMATWFRAGRGTALGVMVGALTLGSATPHLINGLGGVGWRTVIVATSVLTIVGGLVASLLGSDGPFAFPRGRFDPHQVRRAWANRGVRLATLGYFGHMWELYAMWAWFAAFLTDVLVSVGWNDPHWAAALGTFVVIGVGAPGCWVGGRLGDRWGSARSASLAMAISGSVALVIGFTQHGPVALTLALGLVWGFWVVADSAQFSTIVTHEADQSSVGTAVTLQLAAGFVLTVVTIWLVPFIRDQSSWVWAFAVLAPGPFLGIVAMRRLDVKPVDV